MVSMTRNWMIRCVHSSIPQFRSGDVYREGDIAAEYQEQQTLYHMTDGSVLYYRPDEDEPSAVFALCEP